jgi:hypothetical protein
MKPMDSATKRWCGGVAAVLGLLLGGVPAGAQACTTQAKMAPEVRSALNEASLTFAAAVKAGDAAKVQSMTIAEFAANQQSFGPTAFLVHSTADKIAQDNFQVTQLYELDARNRAAGDSSNAEFNCALTGSPSETDFAIPGLPPGLYGFTMVEAAGARPWLLAFLLRQDAGVWKLAGFYPRARTAAGHDGAWYWKTAFEAGKAKQFWRAWLLFGEADELLRPANFVTSTRLDSLRSEQRNALPPELANGLSTDTPLVMKAADGTELRFTGVDADASDDGARLNLVLHLKADWLADPAAATARNQVAARTFLDAHPELRTGFDSLVVFADSTSHNPYVTEQKMAEVP